MQFDTRTFLAILLAIAVFSAGCFKSKNVVTKVGPSNGRPLKLNGVPYALPRTIVQATVPFKKKDKAPGEFQEYAPCFFSREIAAGRVTEKSTTFSIGDATFSSRGEPDPNEHYIAKIKGGYFENKTLLLEFNPDGVITKGDASSTNVAIDVAIKAVRTGISIAASAASGGVASPGNLVNREVEKAELEKAQLNARILRCRATLVAEAASNAAAAAVKAAKASGMPVDGLGEPLDANIRNAVETAKAIEQDLKAKQNHLEDLLAQATLAFNASGDVKDAISELNAAARKLIDDVSTSAKAVRDSVNLGVDSAVKAAEKAPEDPGRKPDKVATEAAAAAATNATKAIDSLIAFQDDAFAGGYSAAKQRFLRIVELKEKRENLASGEALPQGVSAEALQKMLSETDNTIKSYENTFFLGTAEEDSWAPVFEYRPGRTIVTADYNTVQTSPVLIWFSKTTGLCETPATAEQGIKIKPSFKAPTCPLAAADARGIWLSLSRLQSDHPFFFQMATANDRDEQRGERGFYYRIPARAVAKLILGQLNGADTLALNTQSQLGQDWNATLPVPGGALLVPPGTELGRSTMRVAQMGVTASIPASAAGRTTQYTIDFDEATGALKNFKLASNALLEKSLVEETGGAATDILAAKQARDKAKKEATDELTKKQRELELLKTQNLINEEKKKLEAAEPAATPEPR